MRGCHGYSQGLNVGKIYECHECLSQLWLCGCCLRFLTTEDRQQDIPSYPCPKKKMQASHLFRGNLFQNERKKSQTKLHMSTMKHLLRNCHSGNLKSGTGDMSKCFDHLCEGLSPFREPQIWAPPQGRSDLCACACCAYEFIIFS